MPGAILGFDATDKGFCFQQVGYSGINKLSTSAEQWWTESSWTPSLLEMPLTPAEIQKILAVQS
jgi:hypothetical protein